MPVRLRWLAIAIGVLCVASGCSLVPWADDGESSSGVLRSEALDRPVQEVPPAGNEALFAPRLFDTVRFSSSPCQFDMPTNLEARCGTVTVPADWATGDGSIELSVAVFPSTSADPAPDPVIYLEGGPGSHTLDTLIYSTEDIIQPLVDRGDVIFFDQRGAGRSSPQLGCDENTEVTRRLEDDPSISDDQAEMESLDALARCRQRFLDAGIDLTDYNSINNAHDVEAIRRALGYDQWNLYGISYGTKLGLEVLRQHPEAVRTAVLDSVYPPQVDSVRDNPETFVDSYEAVVAACAREAACAAQGDLALRINEVVAKLDAEPIQVEVEDWIEGFTDDVFVTGETLVSVVVGALYSPYRFTDIPEMISELEVGRTDAIEAYLSQDRSTERFFSDGMFYAIACHEEISFADEDEVAAALPADPFGQTDRFDLASNTGTSAFGTCRAFENGRAPSSSNEAVVSDRPTLLMAGTYDPVTPVSWAEEAAKTLSNGIVVVAEHGSHGVSPGECGMAIVREFLDAPDATPDIGCFADEELSFISEDSPSVSVSPVSFDIELLAVSIDTVQPVEWSVGTLNGDQYRQRSFLDPTQLYQLAGEVLSSEALLDAFADDFGITMSGPELLAEAGADATVGSTPVDELSRPWIRRTGQSDSVGIEWFETEIGGIPTVVVLAAPLDELATLLDSVVVPALQAIDVRPR